MKPLYPTSFLLVFVLVLTSCQKKYFLIRDFDTVTSTHSTVAILPFEMIFTGKLPKELTQIDKEKIEKEESKLFQSSFYSAILKSAHRNGKSLSVRVQNSAETIAILDENDIGIRESWSMKPTELAKILGVDAVVTARIEKHRFMSDIASLSMEVGREILEALNPEFIYPNPLYQNRSKEIYSIFSLTDAQDGTALWSIEYRMGADWRSQFEDIAARINWRAAKRFPYRN